jgi:hypothetical protein
LSSSQREVTKVPGLDVLGLQWMHPFNSGLLSAVGSAANNLAEHISLVATR